MARPVRGKNLAGVGQKARSEQPRPDRVIMAENNGTRREDNRKKCVTDSRRGARAEEERAGPTSGNGDT